MQSRLDYCNGVLSGITAGNIIKLQRVQNSLARVTCRTGYRLSMLPVLKSFHWLPIAQRLDFKMVLIDVQSIITGWTQLYLCELLRWYVPLRNLRSASEELLIVPLARTKLAERAFSVQAPKLWNTLPVELRKSISIGLSIDCFKSRLKAHLFATAFHNLV